MELKENLKNKKILFLSVKTFNLEVEIKKKLEELGAEVTYFDERPSNNNFTKGIIRLNRMLIKNRINNYYHKILKNSLNIFYDYLFVNRGEIVPEFFLENFKKNQTNCKLIFYTWDSILNQSHPLKIMHYFDRKFTFDSDDAIKYNINFRPLFFLNAYENIKNFQTANLKYNLLFLGTAHSDRYKISKNVVDYCNRNSLTSFCYYYMQGKLIYLFKKIFDPSFKEFDFKKISFKSLSLNQILKLYQESDVILDINHPNQKGLTMRTFEAIGSGKKIITSNPEIKKYCFYNSKNILVIERDNIKIDSFIFESKYQDIDKKIYEKLTIEGWINCIFFENESNYWIKDVS